MGKKWTHKSEFSSPSRRSSPKQTVLRHGEAKCLYLSYSSFALAKTIFVEVKVRFA